MANNYFRRIITVIALLMFFIVYSLCVKFIPNVTQSDVVVESSIQKALSFIPIKYPVFADKTGYLIMLFSALILGAVYFIRRKNLLSAALFLSIPVFNYFLNYVIKHIVQRPRPDIDLQISWVHPQSFSFVSTHTLITFCLYGMIIYYIIRNCNNRILKYAGVFVCSMWIFITGLCRVLIGVHYPTDVIGACILGLVVLIIYVDISKLIEGK